MIVLSIPMILGKVPPNPIYGFRTRKTLSDPEIWYDVNEFAGKLMFVWGGVMAVAAIVLDRIDGMSIDSYSYAFLAVVLGIGAVVTILSFNRLRKL